MSDELKIQIRQEGVWIFARLGGSELMRIRTSVCERDRTAFEDFTALATKSLKIAMEAVDPDIHVLGYEFRKPS